MRDGDFHLNVLKRLEELESRSPAQSTDQLEETVSHLENSVDNLETKIQELEDQIDSLRTDLAEVTGRIL